MTLQTTNGTIEVRNGHGTFDAAAINGAILLDAELAPTGRHRAQTVNGSVTVRLRGQPSLRIDAHTVNGGITVSPAVTSREHKAHAFAGIIGAGDGALSLQTVNGKIAIE